jgi:CHAT domain-containing protein/tetratricopeptide (TPR) repeat protein
MGTIGTERQRRQPNGETLGAACAAATATSGSRKALPWLAFMALTLTLTPAGRAAGPAEAPAKEMREQLQERAGQLERKAGQLYLQARYAAATEILRQLLELDKRLYPRGQYPDGHADLVKVFTNLALVLEIREDHAGAQRYCDKALAMCQRLYPAAKYPDGHSILARSLSNKGALLEARGDFAGALRYLQRALAMRRRLYPRVKYPDGHPDLVKGVYGIGSLLKNWGDFTGARDYFQEALALWHRLYPRAKYPDGHVELARGLNDLGQVLQAQGDYAGALRNLQQAFAMYERLYPKAKYPRGHTFLATVLNNLGTLFLARGDFGGAERYYQQALAMEEVLYPEAKYPDGHPNIAYTLNNLGVLLQERGDYSEALRYLQRALAMKKKLSAKSHNPTATAGVAVTLNNLGALQLARRDYAAAKDYFTEALAMYQRLYPEKKYPDGHRRLATGFCNLGTALQAGEDYLGAGRYLKKALAMRRRLYPEAKYPDGHPDLGQNLHMLALLCQKAGDYPRALRYYRQAANMWERLFPDRLYSAGHPRSAYTLNNLGALREAQGDYAGALRFLRRALGMRLGLIELFADASAEAQALAYTTDLSHTRDMLLSAARHGPAEDEPAYSAVWRTKATVTRCLERRQRSLAQISGSGQLPPSRRKEIDRLWAKLLDTRRALACHLLSPATDPETHRRRAHQLTQEKEDLEGRLARLLPTFGNRQALERQRHVALLDKLSPATVFIDLVRYVDYEQDPQRPGSKGERWTPCYAAFVLRRGLPVRRVELGPAGPIEQALTAWRTDIRANRDGPAAQQVRRLLWQPLARHVPGSTRTVLWCPEDELTRVPWAALPVNQKGRALLEDCAVAVVPHGHFLLERLSEPAPAASDTGLLVAIGGVHYDGHPADRPSNKSVAWLRSAELGDRPVTWGELPGTARELEKVIVQAENRSVRRLTGAEASTARLLAELPKARWAHLATHGFFADARFRSALRVDEQLFQARGPRGGLPPGARNPLVLSGLVLAGANVPWPQGPNARPPSDGGILTAEAIAGLPLDKLDLVVLSACETGLGELGGGEGSFSLQRAFHLAGCKNVVASLWKVDDRATAALMALFYDKMWRQNKPALEALREAQLTLYHHPERIGMLAGERGPNFDKVVRLSAGPNKGVKASLEGKAPTKVWAGFVLSGLGR